MFHLRHLQKGTRSQKIRIQRLSKIIKNFPANKCVILSNVNLNYHKDDLTCKWIHDIALQNQSVFRGYFLVLFLPCIPPLVVGQGGCMDENIEQGCELEQNCISLIAHFLVARCLPFAHWSKVKIQHLTNSLKTSYAKILF